VFETTTRRKIDMHFNLLELWGGMNNLVRLVVVVLTIQALACMAVTVDRIILLIGAYRKGRRFARQAGPVLASGDLQGALTLARADGRSHLAGFIKTGIETYLSRMRRGLEQPKAAELAARALERKGENLSESLNKGLNILASTGSTAPFIGLLGTVLGILNAFKLVGQQGSGGIGTIGVAIAEALIVTGYGLMVAIPSVLLFNWLSTRIARYEAGLTHARHELVDHLAGGVGSQDLDDDLDSDDAGAPVSGRAGERAVVDRRAPSPA
jgi:biopolymer transport protein ExbB/biopolymer transport protein TolQ